VRPFSLSSLLLAFVLVATPAGAQQIEPRAYSNAPTGVNFLLAGYGYADGSLVVDESLPLKDANLAVNMTVLGYVRSLNVRGLHGQVNAVLPYAWLKGTAQASGAPLHREVDGFGDLSLRFSVNVLGSPALSLAQFPAYRQHTIVGLSLNVAAPTGQYESGKLVNISTNRWLVRPEAGVSQVVGKWTFELATAASFFTANPDFFPGGKKREQAPIYSVQGGVVRSLPHGMWTSLNGTYFAGGRSTIDGVQNDDRQSNTRVALTFTIPATRKQSVKLFAGTGVSTRTGGDYNIYNITWQYRWGGGL
jgi:hypothetical protein